MNGILVRRKRDEKPTNTQADKNMWLISANYQKDSLREQVRGEKRVGAEYTGQQNHEPWGSGTGELESTNWWRLTLH